MTPTVWSTSTEFALQPVDDESPFDAPVTGLRLWIERLLLAGFIFYTFVGTQPFRGGTAETRVDGSIADRILVLTLFVMALAVLTWRWRDALACMGSNLVMFLLVGFCMASIVWSNFPDLTLRRSLLLLFLTTIILAVTVSTDDLRRLHTTLFVSLSAIMLLCLVVTFAMPSIGMSEIGARGVYTQKNVAGVVALVTVVLGVTWLIAAKDPGHRILAVLVLIPTLIFLVLTKSKTSINLTVLGVFVIFAFALAERFGPKLIIAGGLFGCLLLVSTGIWLATLDFDVDAALREVIGDTSFSGRDELWAFVRRDAERRYWLGHGYGAYWDVGLGNDPLVRAEAGSWLSAVPIGLINQAHDGYLELWLHIGLPATVIFTLIALKAAFAASHYALASHEPAEDRALIGGLAALLVLYMLHNFTEASLFLRGSIFSSVATLCILMTSHSWHLARLVAGMEDDDEEDRDDEEDEAP